MNNNRTVPILRALLFTGGDTTDRDLLSTIGFSSIAIQGAVPGLVSVESTAVDGTPGGHTGDNPEPRRGFLGLLSQRILGCDMHSTDGLSLNLVCPGIAGEDLHIVVPSAGWCEPFFFFGFAVIVI
jgi:hypothetical protein